MKQYVQKNVSDINPEDPFVEYAFPLKKQGTGRSITNADDHCEWPSAFVIDEDVSADTMCTFISD